MEEEAVEGPGIMGVKSWGKPGPLTKHYQFFSQPSGLYSSIESTGLGYSMGAQSHDVGYRIALRSSHVSESPGIISGGRQDSLCD